MEKRFIILGCGHTGTTLLSGIMYFSGFRFTSIPTGNFEDINLNDLNEKILRESDTEILKNNIYKYFNYLESVTKGKWCIKDPYLVWNFDKIYEYSNINFKLLVNFRNPYQTINHLFRDKLCHYPNVSKEKLLEISINEYLYSYQKILNILNKYDINYLFIKYEDLLNGASWGALEKFVGQKLNFNFIKKSKNKSKELLFDNKDIKNIYEKIDRIYEGQLKNFSTDNLINNNNNIVDYFSYMKQLSSLKIKRFLFYNLNKKIDYIRAPYPNVQFY